VGDFLTFSLNEGNKTTYKEFAANALRSLCHTFFFFDMSAQEGGEGI
jgi:hypothetical protein